MIESEGLDGRLEEINEIVVSLDVSKFMGDDDFNLFEIQAGQGTLRQQDHRLKVTDGRRDLNQGRLEDLKCLVNAQAVGYFLGDLIQFW